MTVIADSGPLIHLSMVHQFHLLQQLFQFVSTIPQVIDEVVAQGNGRPGEAEVQKGIQDQWIRIVPVPDRTVIQRLAAPNLSEVDSAVLACAIQVSATVVVSDDSAVRRVAEREGLAVTGTVGILTHARLGGSAQTGVGSTHQQGLLSGPVWSHLSGCTRASRRTLNPPSLRASVSGLSSSPMHPSHVGACPIRRLSLPSQTKVSKPLFVPAWWRRLDRLARDGGEISRGDRHPHRLGIDSLDGAVGLARYCPRKTRKGAVSRSFTLGVRPKKLFAGSFALSSSAGSEQACQRVCDFRQFRSWFD